MTPDRWKIIYRWLIGLRRRLNVAIDFARERAFPQTKGRRRSLAVSEVRL